MKYGFYSRDAHKTYMTFNYRHSYDYRRVIKTTYDCGYVQVGPTGELVTCWSDDPEGKEYKWEDKVCVGLFDTTTFRTVSAVNIPVKD